jgi:hypothetical protein
MKKIGCHLLFAALSVGCGSAHDDQAVVGDSPLDAVSDTVNAESELLPGPVEHTRSLVWTQTELLDDTELLSLATLMAAASGLDNGGLAFDWVLREFGRTEFSLRSDQTLMAEELAQELGPDPSTWDLAKAPFKLTAVHLRIDLAADEHCGEFRVSLSTTHATIQPFHMIFLFRMPREVGDVDCRGMAIRLARLSEMSEPEFLAAAKTLIGEHVRSDRFIVFESLEFTFSPWEWRQWQRVENTSPDVTALPYLFENPPAFQAVDVAGLNPTSARRDAFLDWVEANAADIDQRRFLIPVEYRTRNPVSVSGIPRVPLSLAGVSSEIRAQYPNLRQNLEIVGCAACHTADAEFVHTTAERTFSEYYKKELDARELFLDGMVRGTHTPPPFGPLQSNPVLPD